MLVIRRSADRGRAKLGWLDSRHTFSFADYYDPTHMRFSDLRVLNEDRVQPGAGFPTHGHRDMEIISYVLQGALEHKDSMGNGSVIRPGDVQRMSAGTGVRHSEYNHSKSELVHFLQIWILSNATGLPPSYEQKHFDDTALRGGLRLIASPDGRQGSVTLHQDTLLFAGHSAEYIVSDDRQAYVHIAPARASLNSESLATGDAVAISMGNLLQFSTSEATELLLFDLS